ncbi:MAG: protein kinase [Balneolaceae bacterium]|nr:protein kinase [Balneolaceae bacterium]
MVGENISHYKILKKLGEGGMGVVYKARDTNLDRDVALKFLPPGSTPKEKDKHRFRQEARAAARLNHPNICGIHSINEYEGRQFIEMEFIEGKTLRGIMNESEGLEPEQVRKYAREIAEALSAAHRENIIHRDIKPENIMVDKDDRIKVMDFGLAKLKGTQNYTKSGSTVGTVTYMSPEQMQSEEIDSRSDIFSFGVMLYEMLTGIHPFQAEYQQALMFKILNEDPDPPSSIHEEVPADLEKIATRCLHKDRDKRYRSAEEISQEMKSDATETAGKASQYHAELKTTSFLSGAKQFLQSNVVWTLTAGIAVLLLAFIWYYPPSSGSATPASLPEEKNVVVLPLENLSPQEIPQYYSDGIMEILTSKLSQIAQNEGSFWVVPSSAVRADSITSARQAANVYGGVNLAVSPSLQQLGGKLGLTLNLIDIEHMRQLSSTSIVTDWSDHTNLPDVLVQNLATMLDLSLEGGTVQNLTATGTNSSSIYQQFIEGKGYLSRYQDEESLNKAINIFRDIITKDPGYVQATAALAEAYWRKFELARNSKWTDEALAYGRQAINSSERPIPEAHITMALIYNGMGEYEKALEMLDNLEGPEQTGYQALLEKAKANEKLGNTEKAEELYKKAIDRQDRYWAGYNHLGKFYHSLGRLKEASEAFKKVTELAPENVRGYNNLAAVYYNLGKYEQFFSTSNKSLAIKPTYAAYTNMGLYYYYVTKNYEDAIRMYEKALEYQKTDYRVWGALGYAYHWSGKDTVKVREYMTEAIALAQKELEINPNDNEVISQLAGYHEVLGNDDKCRDLLQQLTSLEDPDAYTRISIIDLYERLGNRDAAIEWAEKSVKEGYSLGMLNSLEEVDSLLGDPRMKKLMEKQAQ